MMLQLLGQAKNSAPARFLFIAEPPKYDMLEIHVFV
jgi:hypothetical protein